MRSHQPQRPAQSHLTLTTVRKKYHYENTHTSDTPTRHTPSHNSHPLTTVKPRHHYETHPPETPHPAGQAPRKPKHPIQQVRHQETRNTPSSRSGTKKAEAAKRFRKQNTICPKAEQKSNRFCKEVMQMQKITIFENLITYICLNQFTSCRRKRPSRL